MDFSFDAHPQCVRTHNSSSVQQLFTAFRLQARNEYALFDAVIKSIEEHSMCDAVLPTTKQAIRLPTYLAATSHDGRTILPPSYTCVYAIHWTDILKYSKDRLRLLFQKYNIVIQQTPLDADYAWGPETFCEIGPLEHLVPVHGAPVTSRISLANLLIDWILDMGERDKYDDTIQGIVMMKLREIMQAVAPPDGGQAWTPSGRKINSLDHPLGHRDLTMIAGYK